MKSLAAVSTFLSLVAAAPSHLRLKRDFAVGQTVETSSGCIVGHANANYSEVSEYLGIPFGQAPIGDLRFAAPVKYSGSPMFYADSFGPSCPVLQSNSSSVTPAEIAASNITEVGLELLSDIGGADNTYDEDCLSLNVWTKSQTGDCSKAVMVFIHGGGYTSGGSNNPQLVGASLADGEDVVVVTINYRLSILGYPGNPVEQNNVALLDIRLAVEWIQENIAGFGGDASKITLFGQSAGAGSIDLYSYAFASDPIVAGIIMESGTTGLYSNQGNATAAAYWFEVATALGCGDNTTDSAVLLACMRNVSADALLEAVPTGGLAEFVSPFGPTIDNTLVFANYSTETPASIPVLIGNNDYEAGLFRTEFALAGQELPDALWDEYDLAGFVCPAGIRANASLIINQPIWRYRMFGVFPNVNLSSEAGAYHGIELPLIFNTTETTPSDTADEIAFKSYIRGAWTAFAKDPVSGLSSYEGGWPLYDPAQETLVRLALNNSVGTNLALPSLYEDGCAGASIAALIAEVFG